MTGMPDVIIDVRQRHVRSPTAASPVRCGRTADLHSHFSCWSRLVHTVLSVSRCGVATSATTVFTGTSGYTYNNDIIMITTGEKTSRRPAKRHNTALKSDWIP